MMRETLRRRGELIKSMAQAKLKTILTDASVDAFLLKIPDKQRREDAQVLRKMFEKVVGEKAKMWGSSIVGFGSYHYAYASGREGDWMLAGFSPRTTAFSLYLTGCMYGFEDLSEVLEKLGSYKTGKGCLYIKRLSDVNLKVLEKLIKTSLVLVKKNEKKKS